MKGNTIAIALATLVIGFGVGYASGRPDAPAHGSHQMPDGSMMADGMDMAAMMSSMNEQLRGKTGDDFDRAFLSEMIVHHEGAVEMAELALTNAGRQEVRDLSRAIISAQNEEISQMRSWQDAWHGNGR